MASTAPYPDHDAPAGMGAGPGLYGNQNGGTPPAQQQQHLPSDADLQLQENLAQLQRSSDMMHPGAGQGQQMGALPAHHHFQSPTRPTHSPQQMAQSVMNMEDHSMYSDHDGSRKRSKVSRACDECRRKKIRCDATSENGPEACSSCKRTGARCQFSRQPMKRGPSKGYIKELADRLNSLENQIQNPHTPTQSYDYSSVGEQSMADNTTPSHLTRKRTHSMSEGLQDSYGRPSWSGQDREFSANGQHIRRPSFSDMTLAGNLITGSNEGTIKAYYTSIHPILPILAHETTSLNRLTNCPAKLRESFFLALECSVRSTAPLALPLVEIGLAQLVQQCLETLDVAQHALSDGDSHRQFYNSLVYSQSLAFLIIASDKPGQSGICAELLGRLAGRILDMGLNDAKVVASLREQDRDTFDDSRRLFWVACILDRFHAVSREKDTVMPGRCGRVTRDDFNALGEAGYHLARAADIMGQISQIWRAGNVPDLDPSSPFALATMTASTPPLVFLNGQLTRFQESLDITELPSNSAPQLAYQYLRILAGRYSGITGPKEKLSHVKELLSNLINSPITPLHHSFALVVAASLAELSDRVETRVEANAAIREMDDAISSGHIAPRMPTGTGWDTEIRNLLHQKKSLTPPSTANERTSPATQPNMAGLQHLAAAAVGEREGADVRPTSSGGNGPMAQSVQDMKHDVTAAMAAASEAAAAQATAAAVQKQLQSASGNGNGGSSYDPSALIKEGF